MVSGGMIQTAKCEVDGEEREGRKRTTWFSNSQTNIGGMYPSTLPPYKSCIFIGDLTDEYRGLVKTKPMNLRYIS
jgi:hypothetical protein